MNGVALAVFVFFFGLVTVIGFVAARWRSADLGHLARKSHGEWAGGSTGGAQRSRVRLWVSGCGRLAGVRRRGARVGVGG
jgi:hypothetical protein